MRLNGTAVQEQTLARRRPFVLLYVGLFVVGAAVVAIDTAHRRPVDLGDRRDRRRRDDARQRRPGPRRRRPAGLVRELPGRVQADAHPA